MLKQDILLVIKKHRGSLLIEFLLAFTLVAIMIAVLFNSLRSKKIASLNSSINEINAICQKAFIAALLTTKQHELRFYFDDYSQIIAIGYSAIKQNNENNENNNIKNKKMLNTKVYAQKCIINGKNEFDYKTREIFLIIYPQGYTQECTLVINNEDNSFTGEYFFNPFKGIFEDSNEKA